MWTWVASCSSSSVLGSGVAACPNSDLQPSCANGWLSTKTSVVVGILSHSSSLECCSLNSWKPLIMLFILAWAGFNWNHQVTFVFSVPSSFCLLQKSSSEILVQVAVALTWVGAANLHQAGHPSRATLLLIQCNRSGRSLLNLNLLWKQFFNIAFSMVCVCILLICTFKHRHSAKLWVQQSSSEVMVCSVHQCQSNSWDTPITDTAAPMLVLLSTKRILFDTVWFGLGLTPGGNKGGQLNKTRLYNSLSRKSDVSCRVKWSKPRQHNLSWTGENVWVSGTEGTVTRWDGRKGKGKYHHRPNSHTFSCGNDWIHKMDSEMLLCIPKNSVGMYQMLISSDCRL